MRDDRYLELIEQDGRRLGEVARRVDLDARVPSCPGWTARDCVAHTAEVYQHKLACIRLQRSPGEDYEQQAPLGVELVDWFDGSLAALLAELRARGPATPAYTWWPGDQTVGFWYRRMAQETAVHRLDVEDALGEPTPIDRELAAGASVSGDPETVLLWLWGRRADSAVALDGDPSALQAFRDRLRIATQ